jgi:thiol-disulfide isomerase/thioredoxin
MAAILLNGCTVNWKAFILLCTFLFGALPTVRAVVPMSGREIAMLLRNGEDPQFIIHETTRRKLLQPLSAEEERTLLSLQATPALMNLLRDPATVLPPQAAAGYAAQVERQAALARVAQTPEPLRQPAKGPADSNPAKGADPSTKAGQALAGQPLNLKFDAADGSPVDLARLRGKVVLIDFWATWCGPCMKEVPNVVAAYQKYHDKGFEIIGISLDQKKGTMLRVAAQKGMTWPQYFDGEGWSNAISSGFHIQSIPTMWLVNKNGLLAIPDARADLEAGIARLLAE